LQGRGRGWSDRSGDDRAGGWGVGGGVGAVKVEADDATFAGTVAGFWGLGEDGALGGNRGGRCDRWTGGADLCAICSGDDRAGLGGGRGGEASDGGDAQAEGDGGVVGGGKAHAGEGGHDEGAVGIGGGGAEQEVHAGLVDAGIRRRGLGQDKVAVPRGLEMGEGAEVEGVAAKIHGGLAKGLGDDVGDRDLLGAKAFGDADLPAFADFGSGCGGLGEDASGGHGGGVELVRDVEVEAAVQGGVGGLGDSQAGEGGDANLTDVQRQAEGDAREEDRDGDHRDELESNFEVAEHPWFRIHAGGDRALCTPSC